MSGKQLLISLIMLNVKAILWQAEIFFLLLTSMETKLARIVVMTGLMLASLVARGQDVEGWKLVWSDEFSRDGRPDSTTWNYERGFVRNQEAQWYQEANAWQEDGLLIIEARREHRPNPTYE